MAKVSALQNDFSGGEISPLFQGRVDHDRYKKSLALCQNFLPVIQGGLVRRPGTYFISEVKNSAKKTRLIPFEYSTTQAYMLEFGENYIRVFMNNAPVFVGGVPLEIVTDYPESDLFSIKYAQSADVLYLVHPFYPPRKISRTSHINWSYTDIDFREPPWAPIALGNSGFTPNVTIAPSGTVGTVTLTASAPIFAGGPPQFVRLRHGTTWGYAKVTGWSGSSTTCTATVISQFGGTIPVTTWRFSLFGSFASSEGGYPSAVVFHEDRLFYGGVGTFPQRIDGSRSGDYENFSPTDPDGTVTDSHALSFTLNSSDVNKIRWFTSDEKGLIVGTVGGEWAVKPSVLGEALSPSNINAKRATYYGSHDVQPVQAGKSTMFVQRSGRKVREMTYFYDVDGFQSIDVSVLSEHVFPVPAVQVAVQKTPQPFVWIVRQDGVLLGMTYERDSDSLKVGWHRHIVGGVNAKVESVAVIPSADGSSDEAWIIVSRTIGGVTKRYIEYVTKVFDESLAQEDAFFVDCGLSYSGAATSTFNGLSHLEGQTVDILADGAVHPSRVVTGGSISLDYPAQTVHIGLGFQSKAKMLRLEAGAADGTALGKTRRTHRVGMLLHRSLGLKIGPSFESLISLPFRKTSDLLSQATPLFSGVVSENFDADYDTENQICIMQDQPLPANILAVMPQLYTQDRG